eukprot:1158897-Pelagomonas_calceolata.AAC.4
MDRVFAAQHTHSHVHASLGLLPCPPPVSTASADHMPVMQPNSPGCATMSSARVAWLKGPYSRRWSWVWSGA